MENVEKKNHPTHKPNDGAEATAAAAVAHGVVDDPVDIQHTQVENREPPSDKLSDARYFFHVVKKTLTPPKQFSIKTLNR